MLDAIIIDIMMLQVVHNSSTTRPNKIFTRFLGIICLYFA